MKVLRLSAVCGFSALAVTNSPSRGGVTMAPLTGFSGDGWLAPGEGGYTYLGTGNLERGIAFNPATDHLILVSRNGNSVRLLDAASGEDAGELPNPLGFSTGTFVLNMAGVGDDGAIYVANLQGNVASNAFKVYKWESQSATEPSIYFESTVTDLTVGGTVRVGDSFDVTGSGVDTKLVTGFNSTPSAALGYLVLSAAAGANQGDPPVVTVTPVMSFTPGGPVAGDFRQGITFGKDGPDHVWGKQTSGTARRTHYTGAAGASDGTLPLTSAGETAMDFAMIGGRPLLATIDINSTGAGTPTVRIYDVTVPSAPALAASGTTAAGTLSANSQGVGSIKWGKTTPGGANTTATLYAMAANQGIQAFSVTVTPEATPPAVATDPVSRSFFERGIATFAVSATGTPPLTYQWFKAGVEIEGATSPAYSFRPVTPASAGDYTCRVSGAANPPALSNPATLTAVPSANSTGLTENWQLSPGSRPYLTDTDTQRGLGYNPANGRLYLATRAPAIGIHILNAADGADAGALNLSGVNGGFFVINTAGVAGDGRIYAANLTTSGADYRIYQWPDDLPETSPARIFDGDPIGSRLGDSLAVRGSGADTELAAGAANTNQFVIFKPDTVGYLTAYPVTVTGAANEAFALGIAFGQGNVIWGKDNGGNLTVATYDVDAGTGLPSGSGTRLAAFPGASVPTSGGAIAVNNITGFLAHIHVGDSDNVRLYDLPVPLPDPPPAALSLLDQEFFNTDNANPNGVGSLVFGGDKLFALGSSNGLASYTVTRPVPSNPPVITDVTQNAGNVVFKLKGTAGKTYLIEKSPELTPAATWTADGSVTQNAVEETVTRAIPPGTPRLYWRAREQ